MPTLIRAPGSALASRSRTVMHLRATLRVCVCRMLHTVHGTAWHARTIHRVFAVPFYRSRSHQWDLVVGNATKADVHRVCVYDVLPPPPKDECACACKHTTCSSTICSLCPGVGLANLCIMCRGQLQLFEDGAADMAADLAAHCSLRWVDVTTAAAAAAAHSPHHHHHFVMQCETESMATRETGNEEITEEEEDDEK